MKSIQFKLSDEKYEKVKSKLKESGATWQRVCEQLSEQIILSDNLDEFGLPLLEMAPSVLKQAKSEIEGHLETALWKYIQIKMYPSGRNADHWMQGLKAALKQLLRSNRNKQWKRGYIFDSSEMQQFLNEMYPLARKIVSGHLGIDEKEITVKRPTLEELFSFASVEFKTS